MRTAALVVVLGVVACGAAPEPFSEDESTTTLASPTTTETETTTMPTTRPEQPPIVAPARADLASRLGVDPAEIQVVSAEEVTWPDGSLGCPEPGKMYTQALVEGSKAVLGHEGRVYVYHAGADGDPFLCPSGDKDGGHELVPPPGYKE